MLFKSSLKIIALKFEIEWLGRLKCCDIVLAPSPDVTLVSIKRKVCSIALCRIQRSIAGIYYLRRKADEGASNPVCLLVGAVMVILAKICRIDIWICGRNSFPYEQHITVDFFSYLWDSISCWVLFCMHVWVCHPLPEKLQRHCPVWTVLCLQISFDSWWLLGKVSAVFGNIFANLFFFGLREKIWPKVNHLALCWKQN